MKNQIVVLSVLSLFVASVSHAATVKRGVHVSTDKEIKTNQKNSTAGESDYSNNPARIDQQRMESNPQGTNTDPAKWPKGPATDSNPGVKVDD